MSRLVQMQARFQQKQMQEKEEKLLKLYESQQQKAFEKVNRGSAGSITSVSSTMQAGKVRQMFDERRQKAGIDKSYPLEPLAKSANRSNGITKSMQQQQQQQSTDRGGTTNRNGTTRNVIRTTTTQRSFQQIKNGKPIVGRRQIVHGIYKNNNGDESYEGKQYDEDHNGNNNDAYYNNRSDRDIISMMNDHNLDDSLDNEEMPSLLYDEPDDSSNRSTPHRDSNYQPDGDAREKKNPSGRTVLAKKPETKTVVKSSVKKAATVVSRETKPTVRKSAVKTNATATAAGNRRSTPSPVSSSSPSSSSSRSNPRNKESSPDMMQNRSPSTARPSAKQVAKGPSAAVVRDDLVECRYCNRRFANDRLAVHQEICAKTGKKKRKTYDALKHRVQGTELEPFVKKGTTTTTARVQAKNNSQSETTNIKQQAAKQAKSQGKNSNWRTKHEEFISAIRAAKMAQAHIAKGGKISDLPPPPPSTNPDYVQCPHCGRRFNESAAERHIPKCATYQFNKPKVRGSRSSNK